MSERLDVARLARALEVLEREGAITLLGTDNRVDVKGYPLRLDYTGAAAEVAVALDDAYHWGLASEPDNRKPGDYHTGPCVCGTCGRALASKPQEKPR